MSIGTAHYGWKWDRYNSDAKQYYSLITNSNRDIRLVPFYFLYGGYVGSGSLRGAGSEGDYWSSTAYNSDQAYYLYFYSSGVNPSSSYYRYNGRSIRCLAR